MLERAKEILREVSDITDELVLFNSLSGKDSIVLSDLCSKYFKRVLCCYMYLIKDLEHINRFYSYYKRKYNNIYFVQVPHYAFYNYKKYGFMGMEQNTKQKQYSLSQITAKICEKSGIEWSCFGFKQSDSLNRRLMLRSYKDGKLAINYKSKKVYPLSTYKNKDVLDYILENNLIYPETYGGIGQSCGCDITDPQYLKFLQISYPNDLKKIYSIFPATMTILPNYEAKRNKNNQ